MRIELSRPPDCEPGALPLRQGGTSLRLSRVSNAPNPLKRFTSILQFSSLFSFHITWFFPFNSYTNRIIAH